MKNDLSDLYAIRKFVWVLYIICKDPVDKILLKEGSYLEKIPNLE